MNQSIWQRWRVQIILVILLGLAVLVTLMLPGKPTQPGNAASTIANSPPPAAAVTVVSQYLKAREANVGADQASPTAWLETVRPLTTSSWFSQLQATDSSTGEASGDYRIAHQEHYLVDVTVSSCAWNIDAMEPTASEGVISCGVTDTVVAQATHAAVDASSLPFGWTHSGPQIPGVVKVVKQGNGWLVDNDLTGLGG